MTRKYGAKKDANHRDLVATLEKLGAAVLDISTLGHGIPDLVVYAAGQWRMVDVKNPNTPYGRKGLNKLQRAWAQGWKGGPVYIIRTDDDAIALVQGHLSKLESHGGGWSA